MRKRRRHTKKHPKIILCLIFTCSMVLLPTAISFKNKDENSSEQVLQSEKVLENKYNSENQIFAGAFHDGYVQMEQGTWNPLVDDSEGMLPIDNDKESEESPKRESNPGEKPYPTEWNVDSDYSIIRTNYGTYSGDLFFDLPTAGQVQNKTTSHSNAELLEESQNMPAFKIAVNDEPQVLIMHTHTTETYEPCVRENYDNSFNYRTTDSSKNVVAVGDAITAKLEKAGIGVIHSDVIHDYPSYNGSYERSAETVSAILKEHPSIKVVLDIHRDAICTDTTLAQPVVEIDGKEAAQIMIISGCDDGTMGMPDYLLNFRFACRLQEKMESLYPGFTRPLLFDYRRYNQDLTTGSLLIEVGSHGNTIEQAVYSGELIGNALAEVLLALH